MRAVPIVPAILTIALALGALLLSIWIVVPGPIPPLFVLTVGATELWPIVAAIDASIVVFVVRVARGPARAVLACGAAAALACALVPPAAYLVAGPHVPIFALFDLSAEARPPLEVRVLPNGDIVYAPRGARALPIVIALYGGAWQRGGPGNDARLNRAIASWGYVVVAIDYPHAPQARWPAQRTAALQELERVRSSAALFGGDPSRIALLGHSSGAQLAIATAALRPHELRAVVTYESPVDLELGYEHPSQPDIIRIRDIMHALCGAPPDRARACYRSASPRDIVHAGMPPVLMLAAGRDHVADVGYERILRDTLRADHVPVEYVELAWADHAFETVEMGFHNRIAMWYVRRFLAHRV